jgi:hypothetical protein
VISRGQARAIAETAALGRGLACSIRAICLEEELITRPPSIYNGPEIARCWIAYGEGVNPWVIQSSTVILIDRKDGVVHYVGSANDEG